MKAPGTTGPGSVDGARKVDLSPWKAWGVGAAHHHWWAACFEFAAQWAKVLQGSPWKNL